jgi:uncharacterized protein YecE (DUF72 family)
MASYIGLSGYSYKAWRGPDRFYPPDIKSTAFLCYYATKYRTVELDGVWYRLPSENTVQAWLAGTPPHFLYAPRPTEKSRISIASSPKGFPC